MKLVDIEDHDSMAILTFLKIKFSVRPVKVALLYRSPKLPVRTFIEQLSCLANVKKIGILMH